MLQRSLKAGGSFRFAGRPSVATIRSKTFLMQIPQSQHSHAVPCFHSATGLPPRDVRSGSTLPLPSQNAGTLRLPNS